MTKRMSRGEEDDNGPKLNVMFEALNENDNLNNENSGKKKKKKSKKEKHDNELDEISSKSSSKRKAESPEMGNSPPSKKSRKLSFDTSTPYQAPRFLNDSNPELDPSKILDMSSGKHKKKKKEKRQNGDLEKSEKQNELISTILKKHKKSKK